MALDISENARFILETVTRPGYKALNAPDLYEALCREAEMTLDAFAEALNELEDNAMIVYLKKGRIAPPEGNGFVTGVFRSHAKGFGFVVPDDDDRKRMGDLYIAPENTMGALNGDTVLTAVTRREGSAEGKGGEGRITRIIRRGMETVIGTLRILPSSGRHRSSMCVVVPDDRNLNFTIEVSGRLEDENGAVDVPAGTKVEAEITEYPPAAMPYDAYGHLIVRGRIVSAFGESGSAGANYTAILHSFGITDGFEPYVETDAARAAATGLDAGSPPETRMDLRSRFIMTIDGADAKDLDDAISVERTADGGYLLGVHIADVSAYVHPGSAVDAEAFKRGTSVYFADRVVPMLPAVLSNGCCSLNAGEDKLTLSAMITLDSRGDILSCTPAESIIRSSIRGVYSEFNDLVERRGESPFAGKYAMLLQDGRLDTMLALYHLLDAKSRARGALELETVEAKIIVEDGVPVDIVKRTRGVGEMLIEQFMLCANTAVAEWLFWQDMPCVYRIHEDPSPEKIAAFSLFAHNLGLDITPLRAKKIYSSALGQVLEQAKENGYGTTVSYVLLRSLMKARYSASPSPHFGLAIDKYCHFTSPIRRYPDLAVHRIVKAVLHGEAADSEPYQALCHFAENAAEVSSDNEQRSVAAERAIEDMYKAFYMRGKIGETFPGIISSVNTFGFFVELDNTCEGLVPIASLNGYYEYNERRMTLSCGRSLFALGDKVMVRVEDADVIARRITFSLAEE